jgi:hypothetical protein
MRAIIHQMPSAVRLILAGCLLLLVPTSASAQLGTVHADLPLWTKDWDQMWPHSFHSEDSFGCASKVAFGDWRFDPALAPADDEDAPSLRETWLRLTNYGVFHCYAIARRAYEAGDLAKAEAEYSHFVQPGKMGQLADGRELWLLQIGGRPGSDYLLLARKPVEGIIKTFEVLALDCPKRFVRSAGSIDILSTSYCSINSRGDLIAFARRMAKQPPAGAISWVSEVRDEPEDD